MENNELNAAKEEILAALSGGFAEVRAEIAGLRRAIDTMAGMLLPASQVAEVRRAANG